MYGGGIEFGVKFFFEGGGGVLGMGVYNYFNVYEFFMILMVDIFVFVDQL